MIIKPFIWLSVLATHTCAAVVTLYDVTVTNALPSGAVSASFQVDGTTAYKAINPSPGSDITTYEVQDIRTREVLFLIDGTTTSSYTVLSTPTTFKYNRVEGKSQVHEMATGVISTPTILPNNAGQFAFVDFTLDCQYDVEKQQGICAQEQVVPQMQIQTLTAAGTPTTKTEIEIRIVTQTFTGTLIPIATVTTSGTPPVLASEKLLSVVWGVLLLASSLLLSR